MQVDIQWCQVNRGDTGSNSTAPSDLYKRATFPSIWQTALKFLGFEQTKTPQAAWAEAEAVQLNPKSKSDREVGFLPNFMTRAVPPWQDTDIPAGISA